MIMAIQDIAVPEAESISASNSENEESLSSGGGSNKGEEVKTTLTATADTAEAALVENNTSTSTKKHATKNTRKKYKPRIKDPQHTYPVAPRVIHLVHRPKTHVNR